MSSIIFPVAASLLLGAVMTFGDFFWTIFNIQHRVVYGIAHGALMCLCIGAVIGTHARRPAAGVLAGPVIGVLAAATFYALAPALRWGAMLPAWMLFWLLFAVLQQRLLHVEPIARAVLRGIAAAVLSGAAFYAISGIWTTHSPGGPNYVVNFGSWFVAFLPGFLCLFAAQRRDTDSSSQPSAISHEL